MPTRVGGGPEGGQGAGEGKALARRGENPRGGENTGGNEVNT